MSADLTSLIAQQIKQAGGKLSFTDFMQSALYTPNLGYYTSNRHVLGKHGDFTTAPELSSLFGQSIATRLSEVLSEVDAPTVLEFGAGSGKLCIDILCQLEKLDALPEHYLILEVSGHLKHQQQQNIEQAIPHLVEKIIWLDRWPENAFNGAIIANEVLDAMPVHLFQMEHEQILEGFVELTDQSQLALNFQPTDNQALIEKTANLPPLKAGYQSEVNLFIDGWILQCYQSLNQGIALLIDYGFNETEYYHPDRSSGTLMCHHRHKAHTNPLINIGEQDITAHVDFSHLAHSAHDAGWHVADFSHQASFLLANGLLSLLESYQDTSNYFELSRQVKLLTSPAEMGELFKVMTLSKDIDINNNSLKDMRFML